MRDSGSIVLGWLTKLVLSLAVLGLLAYDGMSLVTANFSAADHATVAAMAASDAYRSSHDVQVAYDAAVAAVAGEGDTIDTKTFVVTPDAHVTLVLHRTASSLWMHRIGVLKKYSRVTQDGEGAQPT